MHKKVGVRPSSLFLLFLFFSFSLFRFFSFSLFLFFSFSLFRFFFLFFFKVEKRLGCTRKSGLGLTHFFLFFSCSPVFPVLRSPVLRFSVLRSLFSVLFSPFSGLPFSVLRSPFSVLRSPFSRSPFLPFFGFSSFIHHSDHSASPRGWQERGVVVRCTRLPHSFASGFSRFARGFSGHFALL